MKDYFVFDGQNASTGTPNKITGHMSFYGTFHKFETKEKALKFVEDNETGYASDICVAGTKRTLRKYDLGSSVTDYNYHLDMIDYNLRDCNPEPQRGSDEYEAIMNGYTI